MANFIAVIDPDPGVRGRFTEQARGAIAHFPGVVVRDISCPNFSAIWATHARAPVTSATIEDRAALVLGDAIDGPGSGRVTAGELVARTWSSDEDVPGPSDGYFAALQYSTGEGLRVWADILGFYPVYYWSNGEVALVGSSPELFRYHPRFERKISLEGLAGVLLINGLVNNTSLFEGVRRLAAGHVLVVAPHGRPTAERQHYRIPLSHELADFGADDLVAEFGDTLERTCRRHAAIDGKASLLLSGGLDSRVIAACAQRGGCSLTAVTFGKSGEQEMRLAWGVGTALGLPHHAIDDSATAPVEAAVLKARWEHLANGFYRGTRWGMPAELAELPQPILGGFAMDFIAGPKKMQAARIAASGGDPFARQFERQSRWGIGIDNIDPLLKTSGLASGLREVLRESYWSHSPHPAKTQWAHSIRHRARYHLGSMAWQIAMVSWPAFPVLDRELLGLIAAMPMAAMSNRRLETDVLLGRFPVLASLPLDRNSHDTQPINPRLKYLVAEAVLRRLPWRPSPEVLYYSRLADFNGPAWKAIRVEAERYRGLVEEFLEPESLTRLLPGPERNVDVRDPIIESNGQRLLLGLILWTRESLS